MTKDMLLIGKILEGDKLIPSKVRISNGLIQAIGQDLTKTSNEDVLDLGDELIVPGLIDVHVHFRDPGLTHKESLSTGSRAAARGGFTTVCTMPNTKPVMDSVEKIKAFKARLKEESPIHVLPYAAITIDEKGEEVVDMKGLAEEGIFAFSDDGHGVQTADNMYQGMLRAKELGLAVVAHAEDNSLVHGGCVNEGIASEKLGLPGINSISEAVQIARDVLLAEASGCHYHVCHVSTKESVRVVRDAKAAGINVTAEVSPHHLTLDEEDIPGNDPNFKMNPPLRSHSDRLALIAALADGTIDCVATDHAPHTAEEKGNDMRTSAFGIVGSEYAFQLLYTDLVKTNQLSLSKLVAALTTNPANIFNLPTGRLEVGAPADITVIDLEKEWTVDPEKFFSKGHNTPYAGKKLTSDIHYTIVDGKIVYDGCQIL